MAWYFSLILRLPPLDVRYSSSSGHAVEINSGQGTTQACLFRDAYSSLTSTGFSIYGLSSDSPKSNTTFKTKQNLPYTLLCDPSVSLIAAIGLKKAPKGTTRGVFVVDKEGKVLAAEAGVGLLVQRWSMMNMQPNKDPGPSRYCRSGQETGWG